LEQKLVDEPVADVLGNLVVLVHRADEKLQHEHHEEVGEGLAQVEAADGFLSGVGGAPEHEDVAEVDEREAGADGEIPAIDQIVLHAEQEDVAVFGEGGEHGESGRGNGVLTQSREGAKGAEFYGRPQNAPATRRPTSSGRSGR